MRKTKKKNKTTTRMLFSYKIDLWLSGRTEKNAWRWFNPHIARWSSDKRALGMRGSVFTSQIFLNKILKIFKIFKCRIME